MCPVFDLKMCKGLYEKYLDIKKRINPDIFYEEPQGVIRIRTTSIDAVTCFWAALGFQAPLLFYMVSNTPVYQEFLSVINKLSANELKNVYIYNAETGAQYSLASDKIESVLLAVHVSPFPQLEEKFLSVFNFADLDSEEEDEDGRECRMRTRDNNDKENLETLIHEDGKSCIGNIKLSGFDEVSSSQIEKNNKIKSNTERGKGQCRKKKIGKMLGR